MSPNRSRAIGLCLAIVAIFLSGVGTAYANDGERITPLSDEPRSLFADPNQAFFEHRVVPDRCTALTDGTCLEATEVWYCPAGSTGRHFLSDDARNRLAPSYHESILQGGPARAYRDTHCVLDRFEQRLAPAPNIILPPTPAPIQTPVPTPTPPAPSPDELAFTGAAGDAATVVAVGLVGAGALVLGIRRRID